MSGIDAMIGGTIAGLILTVAVWAACHFMEKAKELARENAVLRRKIRALRYKDGRLNGHLLNSLIQDIEAMGDVDYGFLGFTSSV